MELIVWVSLLFTTMGPDLGVFQTPEECLQARAQVEASLKANAAAVGPAYLGPCYEVKLQAPKQEM